MPDFRREYPLLSLCGLNCGLCPRYHTDGSSRCPGCGGEGFSAKHPACGVISCSKRHGGLEYCYLCEEHPCKKYDGTTAVDSFITHRNMFTDFERAKAMGLEVYRAELEEKFAILQTLLESYNDGRRKSMFCIAVNLLPLEDLRQVMQQLASEAAQLPEKEASALAAQLLQAKADELGISLKLRKKGAAD